MRGRAGYAFNNILVYGTLGLAVGELKGETGGVARRTPTVGWAGGLGTEVGLDPNWSAKVEDRTSTRATERIAITGMDNGLPVQHAARSDSTTTSESMRRRSRDDPGPHAGGF